MSENIEAVEPPPSGGPGVGRKPRRFGRRWLLTAACSLLGAIVLGAGAGGWWLANTTLVASHKTSSEAEPTPTATTASGNQMPDVRGLDKSTAEQVLADSSIPVSAIATHDAPSVLKKGVVVEQTPAFGSNDIDKVDLGIAVPVTMPNLAGKSKNEAIQTLSGYDISVNTTYLYAPNTPEGTVTGVKPAVGETLDQTATIIVAISGTTLPLGQVSALDGGCSSDDDTTIDGRDYPAALSCSVRPDEAQTTTWRLSKTVDRFTATVGVPDTGAPGSKATFRVSLDGKTVAKGTAVYGTATSLDIRCIGAIQLSIWVGPGGASEDDIKVAFGNAIVYGSDSNLARLAKQQ